MRPVRKIITALLVFAIMIAVLPLLFPPLRQAPRYVDLLLRKPPDWLPVPVQGVKPSGLADTWGAARSGGRRHEGIDIFARRNTPILSVTEGIVMRVGVNDLGGRVIVVMGPGGQRHYYAHLERHSAHTPGDWVEQGEVIGYVGNYGNARSTPPHLHYGIYTSGGAINPYPLLTARKRRASAPSAGIFFRGRDHGCGGVKVALAIFAAGRTGMSGQGLLAYPSFSTVTELPLTHA